MPEVIHGEPQSPSDEWGGGAARHTHTVTNTERLDLLSAKSQREPTLMHSFYLVFVEILTNNKAGDVVRQHAKCKIIP